MNEKKPLRHMFAMIGTWIVQIPLESLWLSFLIVRMQFPAFEERIL
jgi:hypothetical protein